MTKCIHSAIAPNMNRCINCGGIWTGNTWVQQGEVERGRWVAQNDTNRFETDCPNVAEQYRVRGFTVNPLGAQQEPAK